MEPTLTELMLACRFSTPLLAPGCTSKVGRFTPAYYIPTREMWEVTISRARAHTAECRIIREWGWAWLYLVDRNGIYHPAAFTTQEIDYGSKSFMIPEGDRHV